MKKVFLDLGEQPIANGFILKDDINNEEFKYELKVCFDEDTKLITHLDYVDPPLMFNENYVYRGSMSKTMVEHFKKFSTDLKLTLTQYPFYKRGALTGDVKVLEIGSNDGVFLKNWSVENTIAVEPCGNFAEETNRIGYKTYNRFWDTETSNLIKESEGKQDLIFAANCICHIPDLDETFRGIHDLLSDKGVFIFEDPSLAEMINRNSYDQIYDEHPHIFSVISLKNILERNGLTIIRVDNLSVHGGSNRIWAQKTIDVDKVDGSVKNNIDYEEILGLNDYDTFLKWSSVIEKSKEDLVNMLNNIKKKGKKVISYGATSKSTTIFNYCGIDTNLIEYITDTTPEKQGKLSPGVHIPVVPPEMGFDDSVDYVFLGAWNFVNEIKEKESDFVKRGGKFITHVPLVKFE